jgi:Rhs element Vgr protein
LFLEQKMDLVTFIIKVDEKDISKKYQVKSITVQQEINKIPAATLIIIDGEPSKEDFEISSSGEFLPGKKIEIQLGYWEENITVFKGIIVTNTHRINNNCAELNIDCKHEAVKMTLSKSNNHFNMKISASEVATELLDKNKIEHQKIDSSQIKHSQLMQSNVTDWDFMIGRLDAVGMVCLFNNGEVIVKKPDITAGVKLELVYGKNILEFNADMDSRIQSDTVKAYSWDFKTQKVIIKENEETGIKTEDISKPNPNIEIRTSANLTDEELVAISTAKKMRQDLSKIKAKVKYFGTVSAKPGDFIELKGVGEKFNGRAFVSAIQHDFSDGCWITEATLGWSEQFFSEQTNPNHSASGAGQPSSIQGLQIAIVTGIKDDEGEYRALVKLPLVNDKEEGLYARVATLDAGNKRGTFFRPEIDDEVVVGFLNDDPSNPIILGMLHSSAKAAPLEPEKNNNKKGYVSRDGIKLIFDDGDKKFTVETPGGRIFELDDNSSTITLKDNAGNKIVMEQSGITVEAQNKITLKAGTDLALEATQISVKANGALKLEGSASLSLESSGVTEVKGSLVKIN